MPLSEQVIDRPPDPHVIDPDDDLRAWCLWVDSEKIDVYEDGTFYAVVRLRKEGENVLAFVAQDAAGNARQATRKAYLETY